MPKLEWLYIALKQFKIFLRAIFLLTWVLMLSLHVSLWMSLRILNFVKYPFNDYIGNSSQILQFCKNLGSDLLFEESKKRPTSFSLKYSNLNITKICIFLECRLCARTLKEQKSKDGWNRCWRFWWLKEEKKRELNK